MNIKSLAIQAKLRLHAEYDVPETDTDKRNKLNQQIKDANEDIRHIRQMISNGNDSHGTPAELQERLRTKQDSIKRWKEQLQKL